MWKPTVTRCRARCARSAPHHPSSVGLVDLLKNPGGEDFLVDATEQVPPGVDEAAYVKLVSLSVATGETSCR